eukprot:2700434-Prymnesium_polylepis.2
MFRCPGRQCPAQRQCPPQLQQYQRSSPGELYPAARMGLRAVKLRPYCCCSLAQHISQGRGGAKNGCGGA